MSPFEWFVGLRYTRAGRGAGQRNGFISFIAALSVAGISLGVAALIVVLSVMNGFQKEVRDRMLSVLSHIEVYGKHERAGLARGRCQGAAGCADHRRGAFRCRTGRRDPGRDGARRSWFAGSIRRPNRRSRISARRCARARSPIWFPANSASSSAVSLPTSSDCFPGDKLAMIAPQGTVSPAGIIPRLKQFTIRGIFESGHYEYDSTLILAHLADAATFFRIEGASGVRLKTIDMQQAPAIAQDLSNRLGRQYLVRDWSRENQVWFAAVQVEKRMMFIILTLIIAVAAFNLVSMLVMTVTDKRPDIAILRTLGASPRSILSIFMIQGSLIGLLGTLIGVALGVLIALNVGSMMSAIETIFGFKVLPPGIYVISALPSDLRPPDVAWIALISCLLALVATVYPSLRAAAVKPAEALRYE